jgi:SWI/SNF-related matrix-associated actin-dependent regulator of chromatin subfamily A3
MSSKRRQETIAQFSVPLGDVGTDDGFTMNASDEEFLDIEDNSYGRDIGNTTKSKGKGKACTNPKVMLLSLKAVCFRSLQSYLSLK